MKLFCFTCGDCDADFLKKQSAASICPHCKKILNLTGIFEVLGDPEHFIEIEKQEND